MRKIVSIRTKLLFGFFLIIICNGIFFYFLHSQLDSLKNVAEIISVQNSIQQNLSDFFKDHRTQEKLRVTLSTVEDETIITSQYDTIKNHISYLGNLISSNINRLTHLIPHDSLSSEFILFKEIIQDTLILLKEKSYSTFDEYVRYRKNKLVSSLRFSNQIQTMDSLNLSIRESFARAQLLLENETMLWIQKIYIYTDRSLHLNKILLGILLFVSIGLAYLFSRSISINLHKLKIFSQTIAGDDKIEFSPSMKNFPNDEIGELAHAFFDMADNLKNKENELMKKRRLASIGEIVGAVNHEINNPLQIITGKAQILEETIDKGPTKDIHRHIQDILDEANRISKVTKKLRDIRNPVVEDYTSTGEQIINLDKSET